MTSTNTWQGLNVDARPSSKVLKPPGGGSSDIFGTNGGGGGASETPSGPGGVRRVKNHFASNLFLSDEQPSQGVGAAPSKTPGNSFANLFGPPSPPKTPMKTPKAPKDQLNLQHAYYNGVSETVTPVRGRLHSPRHESNGDAHDGGVIETKSNGNVGSMNGTATPAMNGNVKPMTNGIATTAAANGNGPATPKQRVPPGGYSSGLW